MEKLGQAIIKDGTPHIKGLSHVKWNSSGECLASSSLDKVTKVAQMDGNGNMRVLQTIPRGGAYTMVCWNPCDDNIMALTGDEKTVDLWDVRANRAVSKINSTGNNINIAWSPNGSYVCTGNKSDYLAILDVRASRQVKKTKFSYEINEMAWTHNSDHIMLSSGRTDIGCVEILAFDGTEIQQPETVVAHTSNCYCLDIDPSHTRMIVGSADYLVSVWDLDEMICTATVQTFESALRFLSFSGNGERFAAAAENSTVSICSSRDGAVETTIDCRYALASMDWNPKHDIIAVAPTYASEDDSSRHIRGGDKYVKLISFNNSQQ